MLARVAALPADRRRPSAIRHFPPGCGRRHNAAAGPPPQRPLPSTTAAAKRPLPPRPPANPSASAATRTAPAPPPRRTLPAAASAGTKGPDSGVGTRGKAVAAVTARRVSAVRHYPPGCGRDVAVSKPPASLGQIEGASKPRPPAVVYSGEAMARASVPEAVPSGCAFDHGEFNSDGGMNNGGGAGADAQGEGDAKPWVVTGPMAVPLLPWAKHGRRSQRPEVF